MNSIFEYDNYKKFLKEKLHGGNSTRGLQSKLAKSIGCQPSHIYTVLSKSNDLTEDQALQTAFFFKMGPRETNHFLLLIRKSRAVSPILKNYLEEEIKESLKVEAKKNRSSSSMIIEDNNQEVWNYYLSSIYPISIHLLTSTEKFQSISAISKKTNLDPSYIEDILNQLLDYGFVKKHGKKWVYNQPSIHFEKNSKHDLRLQTILKNQSFISLIRQDNNTIHFSSLFAMDKKSYEELHSYVSRFIKKTQDQIHKSKAEDLYIWSLDLYHLYSN